jgi:exopolyphosphatase / guanosine-5'-triphosphate,3'-diphosphate pyrophosphatase
MKNKAAVIDMGTNTFQLGIAQFENGKFDYLFEQSLAPKIGKGGISQGIISNEAIERAINALFVYTKKAAEFDILPTEIYAIATSAVRNAKNADDFCKKIKNELGINITVISGEKEAELIAEGVKYAIDFDENPSLIMDIGGGSVEFIIANKSKLYWKYSFEIGGQRLMDLFFDHDPILPNQVRKLQNYLDEKLIPLSNAIHQYSPKTLVGSAGSFETLADIYQATLRTLLPIEKSIARDLPIDSFYDSYSKFIEFDRKKRLEIPGMKDLRVDMIVVASILIDYVIKTFEIEEIKVSDYALKEGVLSKLAKNEPLALV